MQYHPYHGRVFTECLLLSSTKMKLLDRFLELNLLPDFILRNAIRERLKNTLKKQKESNQELQHEKLQKLVDQLKRSPVAIHTDEANKQHYEVPAAFFEIVLGPWLKYSCGYWDENTASLRDSEEKMLKLTIERAEIENGTEILDLGCGWGSFSLYAARKFPDKNFTAVSNSASQKQFITARAKHLKLKNLRVITSDVNDFKPDSRFDRIVSVEMFEHVRNYRFLFDRISHWLQPGGKLFIHIFNHREFAYTFNAENNAEWMARNFFAGGIMPSETLFDSFTGKFNKKQQWNINGNHYGKTLEAWLKKMDHNKKPVMEIFGKVYNGKAERFWVFWRIFFMACAETFKMNNGTEWQISHYLYEKPGK